MSDANDVSRRWLIAGLGGAGAAAAGFGLGKVARAAGRAAAPMPRAAACEDLPPETSVDAPVEDLMREHAVLERVLLVYEEGARRLRAGADLDPGVIAKAGGIVHDYIEEHHERDEERHVFPRLVRVGVEEALVATLLRQHEAGRGLTAEILRLAAAGAVRQAPQRARLADAITSFIKMYRPHAARENTVLFPAFRRAVGPAEYESLGAELEHAEVAAFGPRLFERIMGEVGELERAFGLDDLASFTPTLARAPRALGTDLPVDERRLVPIVVRPVS